MPLLSDTIAAIATPPGLGGIAILRISGPDALILLRRLFSPGKSGDRNRDGFCFHPRHMHYGRALDKDGDPLDEALAVFMPGPHSATGEDVGEIHCHGGPGITSALLDAALAAGGRLAGPGEFTRRAFLNGRIDLTQAEAVAEMISAPTREGVRLAAAKLAGTLGREVESVRTSLDALRVQVTLAVDFPDEDAELLPRDAFRATVDQGMAALRRLLSGFERARLWREGALAVLAGRVNAGKSSLLNALLGRDRAIVSDRPGTTRDYIEESVNIKGLPLRLVDTAGLRLGGDLVEEEGIRRSRDLARDADLLIFVMDAGRLHTENGFDPAAVHAEETDFLQRHASLVRQGRLLLVLNKADSLVQDASGTDAVSPVTALGDARAEKLKTDLRECLAAAVPPGRDDDGAPWGNCPCFVLSARSGQGLDGLASGLHQALLGLGGEERSGGDVAPNLRQSGLLHASLKELEDLAAGLEKGYPPEILGVHLETAAVLLAEVTGSSGTEELLDSIFAGFCIGK